MQHLEECQFPVSNSYLNIPHSENLVSVIWSFGQVDISTLCFEQWQHKDSKTEEKFTVKLKRDSVKLWRFIARKSGMKLDQEKLSCTSQNVY